MTAADVIAAIRAKHLKANIAKFEDDPGLWGTPDWDRAHVDPGGTIFGPGPYLKVPIVGGEWDGTTQRVRLNVYVASWRRIFETGRETSERMTPAKKANHATGTAESVAARLRLRADLFEKDSAGWALAQANLPQALREAADEIDALIGIARGLMDVAAGRVHSLAEVDAELKARKL